MIGRLSSVALIAVLSQLFGAALYTETAVAQITIDRAWFEAQVGEHTHTVFDLGDIQQNPLAPEDADAIQDLIDNRIGPEQTYDFRGLPFEVRSEFTAEFTSDVESLEGSGEESFSSANFGSITFFEEEAEGETIEGTAYNFFELTDGALRQLGFWGDTNQGPFVMTFSPPDSQYALPLTDGTQWSSATTRTIGGFAQDVVNSAFVEGYGTLILPGGIEADALRIKKTQESSVVDPIVNVQTTFEFLTREGHRATISLSETLGATEPTLVDVSYTTSSTSTAAEGTDELPERFELEQNYPNPFNPATTIGYGLPETTPVRLVVYDASGRQVAVLVDQQQAAGRYEVRFRPDGLASGVYLYRLEAGPYRQSRALFLLN